ncbi:hypothetical protein [Micromonospora sp. DPT]|uniref:hypothetical protein n=1 Tax=Micromonospora sp. DPT TaxID=3142975 RepID=UPI0032087A5A
MTITAIRPTRISGADPLPRGTCLGKQDPDCAANIHGTYSAYVTFGCRCPHAREAKRIYQKRRREHRSAPRAVEATGTRRRLRALCAIGWRAEDLGEQLGLWRQNAHKLLQETDHQVTVVTATRVKALYARLSGTPGTSPITRRRAIANGWAPPLAWEGLDIDDPAAQPHLGDPDADVVDEVAARRVLDGEDIPLTDAERDLAFRIGLARGMTVTAIGHALHLSGTTARTRAAQLTQAA